VQAFLPGVESEPGAFSLVGMGAMVSATTHAPLTAMLIIFEMTGSYHIMLPLMFTTIIALVTSRALSRDSIYTLKLTRRGVRVFHGRDVSVLERHPVSRIMRTEFGSVREDTTLGEIARLLQRGSLHDFPVVDANGRFVGMVWFEDVREVMLEGDVYDLLIARDVMGDPPPKMASHHSLAEALLSFSGSEADALPVFDALEPDRIVGVVSRSDLMRFYERVLLLREHVEPRT
jgi:CIC family chloride channel protein